MSQPTDSSTPPGSADWLLTATLEDVPDPAPELADEVERIMRTINPSDPTTIVLGCVVN